MTERLRRAKARKVLSTSGYKAGGHFKSDEHKIGEEVRKGVHEHESNMHPGKKLTKLKLKDGGMVDGGLPTGRARKPRSAKKPHTQINIAVGGPHRPAGIPMPTPPVAVPPSPQMNAPMPPPGAMPGAGPGFKKGGSVKVESGRDKIRGLPEGKLKNGGKAKVTKIIDDGAGGGLGRLEKAKAYGARV